MDTPYLDFAKAYLRYTQQINPTKKVDRTLQALQLIEASLLELGTEPCITKVTQRHFDKACEILQKRNPSDCASIGAALKKLAENISTWHLTTKNVRFWEHPFRGKNHTNHLKNDRQAEKNEKLPDEDAILALAEVFSHGFHENLDDEDTFITSLTCMLLSAPMRIGEILWHKKDIIREDEVDSFGNKQLYFSYWVPKNGQFVRKEVPSIMAEHAKEAVRRLIKITEEGRRLALHYESGSTKFYRHANCPNVDDNHPLTPDQVADALGFKDKGSAVTFIYQFTGHYKMTGWTLNSLWELVLHKQKLLNKNFPYQQKQGPTDKNPPLKMSESLFCFRYMQLSSRCQSSPVLLAPINSSLYSQRLGADYAPSMNFFVKHNYDNYSLRSHQLRHFLNTLAQEAGANIEMITQWSTRASSTQTRVYMHQDPMRKAKKIAEQLNLPANIEHKPITQEEYNIKEKGPIIVTRYGICTHDYTQTLCNKHADCLNCSDLLMCKGHKKSIKAIKEERNRIAENLLAAKAKVDTGERVAGRWYNSHKAAVEKLDQLLEIMTDPTIANGSPIQMRGKDFSHEKRIIKKRVAISRHALEESNLLDIKYSEEITDCLRMLNEENDV